MKTQTIRRRRGDTKMVRVLVGDSAGVAEDISGATFKLTVDPEEAPTGSGNNIFQASGTIIDAAEGIVDFAIPGSEAIGDYYYDVEMTAASGEIETVAAGRYIVAQDITK